MNWWDSAPLADAPGNWWEAAPIAPSDAAPEAMTQAPEMASPLADALIGALTPAPEAPTPLAPSPLGGIDASVGSPIPEPPTIADMDPLAMAQMLSRPRDDGMTPVPAHQTVDDTSSLWGDLRAAKLQAQQIILGLEMFGGVADLKQARDRVVSGELGADLGYAPEPGAHEAMADYLTEKGARTIAGALPEFAALSEQIAAIPMNPAAQAVGNADTFGEGIAAAASDPLGVLRSFGVRSLGTSIPSILGAVGGGALGGPVGAAVGAGGTGAGLEASMSVGSDVELALRQAGVDVSSPEAVAGWVNQNPEAFQGVLERALGRAGVIAATDAATGAVTGSLARAAARSGSAGKIAETIASGALIEPLGEGAGEAGAQYATTGKVKPGDVLAEMAGGAGPGVVTTAGQVATEAMAAPEKAQVPQTPISPLADVLRQTLAPEPVPAETPVAIPPEVAALPEEPSAPGAQITPQLQPAATQDDVAIPVAPSQIATQEPDDPVQAAPQSTEAIPEPPLPQKKPLTNLARRAGMQIDPDGAAGKELRRAGLTVRTHPGLFKRGGMQDIDNIVAAENPALQQILGTDDTGNYLPRDGLLSALIEEANGRPVQGADQIEAQARRDEWEAWQRDLDTAYQAAPLPVTDNDVIPSADVDWAPEGERFQSVQRAVARTAETLGLALTPDEYSGIVAKLDRDGGSIEQAVEHWIIRSVLEDEAGSPLPDEQAETLPGFDEGRPAQEDQGAGAGGAGATGRDPGAARADDAGNREPGRAGPEDPTGLTTEPGAEGLPQYVVPGTEKRQTGDEQRTKAEMAALQQQSKIRRAGQSRVEDDENGLFGEPAQTLLERKTPLDFPARNATKAPAQTGVSSQNSAAGSTPPEPAATLEERRPGGRLSPTFLDFSVTNRASVYGSAFRAAGLDPDEARNLPVDQQTEAVAKALTAKYGVKVDMPRIKVQTKNVVGRMVPGTRQSISTREGLDQLLSAYRQMGMMAAALGVPEKAMGLEIDGKPITLSLVSMSKLRGALGAYSFGGGGREITLPGRSNSFAHEWGHALDHYLAILSRNDEGAFLTRRMDTVGAQTLAPKAALVEAFAGIMNALYGDRTRLAALQLDLQRQVSQVGEDGDPTPAARQAMKTLADIREGRRPPAAYLNRYFASSDQFDKMAGAGGYFTDPAEMFARAVEAHVGRSVAAISDLPQDFLSKGEWGYDNEADARLAMTFPKGIDAQAFSVAMVELSHAMNLVGLFGRDGAALSPEDVDIYSDASLLRRLPKINAMDREKQAIRESVATWRRVMKARPSAAISDVATGVWREALTSTTAAVHAVAAAQRGPEAKRAFQKIADMIGHDPGSGRLIRKVMQEEADTKARRWLRMVDGALGKAWQGKTLTEDQSRTLRALLTGQQPPASAELRRLAADLRTILNQVWYDLKEGGVKVGFADGYLPRISDVDAVNKDPAGFLRDAAKVYRLMFTREVIDATDPEGQIADMKAVIAKMRAAVMPTSEGDVVPASRFTDADEALIQNWRDLMRRLKDAKKPDTIARLTKELDAAHKAVLEMLRDRFADYSAENWRTRMRVGHMTDFEAFGPTASFLEGRVLPPETDRIMEKFLVSDPVELITGYVHSAARRAEFAKRFGPSGEKLQTMLEAAEKDGATDAEIALVRKAVNAAAGRFQHPSKVMEQISSTVFFFGTVSMLGRATFASLAEPFVAGLRTGDLRDTARSVVANIRALVSAGRREDLFELSRVIGVTTSSLREGVMANRLGADSAALTRTMSTGLAMFFQKSLLTPLTNLQHASIIPVAHAVVMRHLRRLRDGGEGQKFSNGELNELGIPEDARADLLDWLESLDGVPNPDDLIQPDGSWYNPAAELWARAVTRLTFQIIQNPLKTDRPILANHPSYAACYGIMSFIMAFHRQILRRNLRRLGTTDKTSKLGKAAAFTADVAHLSAVVGTFFVGQFLATVAREALFNTATMQEKDDDDELLDWLLARAFSRTGLTGAFDPLVQMAIGVKYERDLTTIAAGPHLAYFLQNLQRVIAAWAGRNSPNTNAAEHTAARAFYQLAMQPVMMAGVSLLGPAGPATGMLSTGAIWWGSSPWVSDAFATALTGEKGSYKDQDRDPPWWEIADKPPED